MDVTSTIAALRQRCPSFSNRVFGAAKITEINLESATNPVALPACYVMCIRENADGPNQVENGLQQVVEARVAVVILVSNQQDERGQKGAVEAENLKAEIFKAILGWSPTPDPQSIYVYDQMWVLANNRSVLAIQVEFTCDYALGVDDSRIPDQLNEDCGYFDKMYMDVDKIETPPGAPDGQIDTHIELKGLYGDSIPKSSENSESEG